MVARDTRGSAGYWGMQLEMKYMHSDRKKRNKEEIVASILDTARKGVTKTRIMYVSFLSFNQLRRYLDYTLENGLLDIDGKSNKYITTIKGLEFLKRFEDVHLSEDFVREKRRLLFEILEKEDYH